MIRKFIKEGPDKKGRLFIIEVDEDKSNSTRNVIRFICEVQNQETIRETHKVADLILESLNKKEVTKYLTTHKFEPKFKNGQSVIVNNQFVAVVFSAYNMFTNERGIIYQVIADSSELVHRIRNKRSQDYEIEEDKLTFEEDYESLLNETEQVCKIEVGEDELQLFKTH